MSDSVAIASQFSALVREEFQLCDVSAQDVVVVYSDPAASRELAAACLAAAQALGAEAALVTVPLPDTATSVDRHAVRRTQLPRFLLELAKQATFVVDVTSKGMLHSTVQHEILESGTRMLRIREPLEVLARLFPTPELRAVVERSAQILDDADHIRLYHPEGTDLRVKKGHRRIFYQYGYTAEHGHWDHWGTGLVAVAPIEESASGTLVMRAGDIIFLEATIGRYIPDRIVLTLDRGRITNIEGGADEWLLKHMLGDPTDPFARRISHIGWGCDLRASWDALERYRGRGGGGADIRSLAGGVVVAFGANSDMGGTNVTTAHVDLALAGMNMFVDNLQVVDGGRLTSTLSTEGDPPGSTGEALLTSLPTYEN